MPITEFQKNNRRKYLGSSDAASIIGVNPYRNAADIYWDKIRPPSENPSEPNNDAIIVGNFCENAVLEWFAKDTGNKIIKNQSRVHENGIMAASMDALVVDKPEIVEAKTAGIIHPFDREQWGEIGTDQVPERIIVQTQHQMAVAGPEYRTVWVPVLLGGIGFRLYRVDRNDELIEALGEAEVNFWNEYVLKKTPPPDQLPCLETLKKIHRQPFKTVTIDDEVFLKWQVAKAEEKRVGVAKEEAEKALLAALGDAEEGLSSMGRVTYLEQIRKAHMVKESKYRALRFKKGENYDAITASSRE